ncbi:glutamate receptor ionotropic, NMDA 1 [Lingula anatina]|uniref:Glutamate [NMDA] receptor subunit 1 n=1 Tax=Lingula anatina TaxID=7574 RepID=A0A1S3K275_LINAN|nr:glutamate receptor ionotropic, NMDA 1 [Lingula anatina]|eukprot:XP_013416499.1 glutamate receptor ionotropic, NMDA 1 [Lingula anatina]
MVQNQHVFLSICLPLLLTASCMGQTLQFPNQIIIGGVLGTQESMDLFHQCIEEANQPGVLPGNITVKGAAMLMDENPIRAARDICLKMIYQQVYVVLVSHPHPNAKSPLSVSYTCKFYNIPVIGVGGNLRDSIFSEKSVHATFLRTVTSISHQADLWLELLKFYKWKKTVFITELTQEGRNILSRFQNQAKSTIELEKTILLKPGLRSYSDDLLELEKARARVVLMFVSQSVAEVVYRDAVHLNLTGPGFVWIVTEQALTVQNIPQGILGFQLRFGMNESLHIKDAMHVVVKAINTMYNKVNLTEAPNRCISHTEDEVGSWDSGQVMFNALKEVEFADGKTGKVKFDEVGDRDSPVYDLVNVQEGKLVTVGTYEGKMQTKKLNVRGPILWPGGQMTTPLGENIETHLKVVTIEEVPFVFSRVIQPGEQCKTMPSLEDGIREIYCPHINVTTGVKTHKCCKGYCIDLLFKLGTKLNFTYDVHLVGDGKFGVLEKNNRTAQEWNGMMGELLKKKADLIVAPLTITPDRSLAVKFSKPFKYQGLTVLMKRIIVPLTWNDLPFSGVKTHKCCKGYCIDLLFKLGTKLNFTYDVHLVGDGKFGVLEKNNRTAQEWNGMMGELLKKKADLIVAPLTITPDRSLAVKFSKPFKYQGLTVLMKRGHKDSNLGSFLQPFQPPLWILVLLSVHVVALVLYLLDRFSPFGHYKLAKSSDESEEHPLDLSTAIWFAWGVLLSSGIGEGTPRSFSARVVGMVWAGFAMIIIASYTANLAAFLVLDRPPSAVSGIDDRRLRNPTDEFIFNTVKDSSVEDYFKRRVELSTMHRTMGDNPIQYETPDEAIKAVIEGKQLDAFIWESTRLEYEAARRCDLVTAAEMFGKERLGIAVRHGSPYAEAINLQVLGFHEEGDMESLDGKWILKSNIKCNEINSSPATLGLTNMAGVFMLVAGGILSGIFIVFVEITYHRHVSARQKEMELARHAAARWRGNIEKRKTLRASWAVLRKDKADDLDEKRRMQRSNQLEHEQLQQLHNGADGKLVNGRGALHRGIEGAAQAEPVPYPTYSGGDWEQREPEYTVAGADNRDHSGQRVDIV